MKTDKKTTAAGFDFEKSLDDLEGIVQKLEAGKLSLDESLKLFEQGVELARRCKTALDAAELKVSKLVKDKEGLFDEEPLEENG